MNIKLIRKDKMFHFVGKTNNGIEIHMDASKDIGGEDKGIRPMTMLLYALGGCSGIDMVLILKKQKQKLDHIEIEIQGEREQNKNLFTKIHVHFLFQGNLNIQKIEKALKLTFTKYCSVARTLNSSAKISYSFSII